MNLRAIVTVWGKELRDSLRDRRTLISTLVIPTVIVPLLSFVALVVSTKIINKAKSETPPAMILGGADSPKIVDLLRSQPKFKWVSPREDWKQEISEKRLQAVVEVPEHFDEKVAKGERVELRIYHYEGELRSGMALGDLRRIVGEYRDKVVGERLAAQGLSPDAIKPFDVKAQNVAPPEKVGGNIIGGFLPYIFILFCFTGCLYPAIDLTAGEKERGTMETILSSPISRLDLVIGKFLMVLTAALTTVVCSLISMGLSLTLSAGFFASNMKSAAASAAAGPLPSLDPLGFVGFLVLMLPLAAVFAATLLALALIAKSTKEAQSIVSPLIVVIIIPAMMGMLPGMELNGRLALVPILNLALASKEMFSGVWHWNYLALIFGSSCVYAGIALSFCVRQFNREDVIFKS